MWAPVSEAVTLLLFAGSVVHQPVGAEQRHGFSLTGAAGRLRWGGGHPTRVRTRSEPTARRSTKRPEARAGR